MSSTTSPCDSSADEGGESMARNNSRGAPVRRVELDLTSVLSSEQLMHIGMLVNTILDRMEHRIREGLEKLGHGTADNGFGIQPPPAMCFSIPNPRSEQYKDLYGNLEIDSSTYKQLPRPGSNADSPAFVIPNSLEEATLNTSKSQQDLLADSVRELQKDLATYFFKFRSGVQRRVQDITVRNGGTPGDPGTGTAARQPPSSTKQRAFNQSTAEMIQHVPAELLAYLLGDEYPVLSSLSQYKRGLILHCMLLLVIGLEQYASYSRPFLEYLADSLKVPRSVLADDEIRLAAGLAEMIKDIPVEEIYQRRLEESTKQARRVKGANIDVPTTITNGSNSILAPSLVTQGIGSMFLGRARIPLSTAAALLGNVNDSAIAVGSLFGLYGGRVGGKSMETYAKDVQEFGLTSLRNGSQEELVDPKDVKPEHRRLRVCLAISGWVTDVPAPFEKPWKVIGDRNENYTLQWETDSLAKMGLALETATRSKAWGLARSDPISQDVFMCLQQSLWPASLIKISKLIENPWTVGMVRAEKAGQILAESLLNRLQGDRSISLIGFSLGARVIYACLLVLAEKRAFGLVHNVLLMGAPVPIEARVWASMRSVVTGRLVNAYSRSDYLLGFLSRGTNWKYGVAGLQKVQGVLDIENIDLGDLANNHLRYQHLTSYVLQKVNWEDLRSEQISLDKAEYDALVQSESKMSTEPSVDLDHESDVVAEKLEQREKDAAAHRKQERASGRTRGQGARQRESRTSSKSTKIPYKQNGQTAEHSAENQQPPRSGHGGLGSRPPRGNKASFETGPSSIKNKDIPSRPAPGRQGRNFRKPALA